MADRTENDLGVIMNSSLSAAKEMHVAFALSPHRGSREALLKGLHSALIIAEQCRQAMDAAIKADIAREQARMQEDDHAA